ncbi:hypothetical protein [Breznakiella homolactica]|nr:hypothetical protein [Breznakiella homolactica]
MKRNTALRIFFSSDGPPDPGIPMLLCRVTQYNAGPLVDTPFSWG